MSHTIAPATLEDVEAIRRVAERSWPATYAGIFEADFIEAFLTRHYSAAALAASIAREDDIFLVARDRRGELIAFAHAGSAEGGTRLYRLYALPEQWHSGVGTALLDVMEAALGQRGVEAYHCFVHRENAVGRRFYERRGFRHKPERDHDDE